MPKPFRSQIVSANQLSSGKSVYRTHEGTFSADFREAAVAQDPETLQQWLENVDANELVGAYGIVVETINGIPEPVHYRERIRVMGLTFPHEGNLDQQWQQARKTDFRFNNGTHS